MYFENFDANSEFEIKFGTKGNRPLTRNNFDNVIQKLKSNGFKYLDNKSNYYLRIQSEYSNTGGNSTAYDYAQQQFAVHGDLA